MIGLFERSECRMERKYPHLFSPYKIRNFIFKNRIVSAPLGAWVFSPRNFIFDYAISMFEEKALGGAASVTVGHTEVNAEEDDSDNFGLYFNLRNRQGTAALSEFAAAIQQHGAHASVQMNYGGVATGDRDGLYYGPSGYVREDGAVIHEMDEAKIMKTIGQYVDSAKKLKLAGFHLCMIHGAHGWLPAQFLSPVTNHRTDRFGGSLENRMRFNVMLVNAVREGVGDDMMVEYRISGLDPETDPELFEESVVFIKAIENKIDLLHVSSGGRERKGGSLHTFPTYLSPRGTNIHLAAPLKKRVNVPIIVVGAITEPEMAEQIIAESKADFVAMCRGLIADPHLPNKARRGQEEDILPCIGCYNCLEFMHKRHYLGCDVNPRTGREHRIGEVLPAKVSKKVTVVGGGPAGMQAAITAAERGHKVTLYEKSEALGGLLKITDGDPVKYLLKKYKDYLIRQVEKHGIDVKLNTNASPELVEAGAPDVVIVASGSSHIIPDIPGVNGKNVITAVDAHKPGAKLGKRVVIIGGNLGGCETALYMKHLGKEVTIVEMTGRLHADANDFIERAIEPFLEGVRCLTDAKCTEISNQGVHVEFKNGKKEIIPADTVILAVGMKSNSDTVEAMLDCALDVIPVGDCIKPGTVQQASRTAYHTALDI
jgi:2,4-dienoyl-CoA reductase-like NADH-dependent reductase (Old Yellow Enzyme family)/thioredoxin reductase